MTFDLLQDHACVGLLVNPGARLCNVRRMRRVLIGSLIALAYAAPAAAAVPSGFAQESYTSNELKPATGAAWATDGSGRLFVLRKDGSIRVVRTVGGRPQTQPGGGMTLEVSTFATEPAVHTSSESGLLGIALDPNYVVNRYLYVFVSVSASQQQIVRYIDVDGGTDAPGIGTDRTVIVAILPTKGGINVGGGLAIGGDGKLYFSIGDLGDGTGVDADLTSLASKVGRANLDGTPANDNPFNDGVGPNNEYIWARGLRNPFGLSRQPSTGKLWTTVAGTSYEQVFLLEARAHAGYNDYENNQPASYLAPKIAYRTNGTDTRNVASAVRAGGTLTVTTTTAHGFRVGQSIEIAGVANASFNGNVYVRSVSATSFTAAQAGADASAGAGGTAKTKDLGGAITRGTFYDGTAFPTEYRGNFFFGDYNTGNLVRAVLSATNEVERVDVWGTGFNANVQVATGDDGALYALGYTTGVLHRVSATTATPRLVVSNTTPHVLEGGRAAFTVALSAAPAANVTVTVARSGGDADIDVLTGGSLTFTPTDWQQPRAVILAAASDADSVADVTDFDVSAPGLATERVVATSIEANGPQLVLSTDTLHVPEGGQATITVAWSAALSRATTVTVRRVGGDPDVTVVEPATLSFTPANSKTPQTVTFAAAHDDDGIAGRAQIAVASPLGARALEVIEVDDEAPPPSPDAGPDDGGTQDASVPDAATVDPSRPQEPGPAPSTPDASAEVTSAESEGGCNCNAHGKAGSGALWIALGLLFARRRRASRE